MTEMGSLNGKRTQLTATVERTIKRWDSHLNRYVWNLDLRNIKGANDEMLKDACSVGYSRKWKILGELKANDILTFRAVIAMDEQGEIGFFKPTFIRRINQTGPMSKSPTSSSGRKGIGPDHFESQSQRPPNRY